METINHEYYVSHEVAKLLKEAGFDWKVNHYYFTYNGETKVKSNFRSKFGYSAQNYNEHTATMDAKSFEFEACSRPTLDVAQRWLREVKHLDIIVNRNFSIYEHQYSWEYEYVIIAADGRVEAVDCYFDVYEEAQEAGIKKALEIILEKGE